MVAAVAVTGVANALHMMKVKVAGYLSKKKETGSFIYHKNAHGSPGTNAGENVKYHKKGII